ncbi:SgcJ/EcaC family oxidoreductase [Amycolatopsis suaedae]|uniref:SgcJ/EcaC family oxidoreductase n=1 Tax=Amycolatopsis suaedae TaxID=2510978 RepID=A0A4Q7IZV9_9PSEU|nr:SgcJ/EcaC family oxidoreductase [Amycolatopsis suaedae]RZQ60610.1 SgcJ/EcaC family oxidoreductase [Amycolatopsis suaedae]
MGRRLLAAAVAAAGVAAVTLTGVASAGGGGDREAFAELVRTQQRAWEIESGALFASTFTRDGSVVTFNGDHLVTRPVIAAEMQRYFDHYIEDTTFQVLGEHVQYLRPDLVTITRTTCLVTAPATGCRDGSLSVNTNLLTKERGGWRQAIFQNTRKVPLP